MAEPDGSIDREANRPGDIVNIIPDLSPGATVWINTTNVTTTLKGEVTDVMTNTPGTRSRARKVSTILDLPEESSFVASFDVRGPDRRLFIVIGLKFGSWSYPMITTGKTGQADRIRTMAAKY